MPLVGKQEILGRDDASRRLALSNTHISTGAVLEWTEGGSVATLKAKGLNDGKAKSHKIRGIIRGFSEGSRHRLLKMVGGLNRKVLPHPHMVTLTYPRTWPADWHRWKLDLKAFIAAWERQYGLTFIIWRLELQQRGAPHYHLLVFMLGTIDPAWVADTWTRIVTGKLTGKRRVRTQTERVRSWHGVMSYASKYMSKVDDNSLCASPMGRQWGVIRPSLSGKVYRRAYLTQEEFQELRWRVLEYMRGKGRDVDFRFGWAGIWAFITESELLTMLSEVVGVDIRAILSRSGGGATTAAT